MANTIERSVLGGDFGYLLRLLYQLATAVCFIVFEQTNTVMMTVTMISAYNKLKAALISDCADQSFLIVNTDVATEPSNVA